MEKNNKHQCSHCNKDFLKESSLMVHMCEPKRRYQEQNEAGVQLGLHAYLKFYEIAQGSSKFKTFDDFAKSAYYKAFVKFGRYCRQIHAVNTARFIEWLVRKNKKIDNWCSDNTYTEYLSQYVLEEQAVDAVARAIETALDWQETTKNPSHDYLRFGNRNSISHAITTGRITGWVLYNSSSGQELLESLNQEQVSIVWSWINPDIWSRKFHDYPADAEYTKHILQQAGW